MFDWNTILLNTIIAKLFQIVTTMLGGAANGRPKRLPH